MRSLYKQWSDKKPFTRRARIYQGDDWRLQLEDQTGKVNLYFRDKSQMEQAYAAFIGEHKSLGELLEENENLGKHH